MLDSSDYDARLDALTGLQNTLNSAERDVQIAYVDSDPSAGHDAVTTLREAASDLATLIEHLEADVKNAEDAARSAAMH